ncbi:MAG TPA: MFS transporter, partial [Povalibacter sp.]
VFTLSYLTAHLGLPRTLAVTALAIGGALNAVCILMFGTLSDRYGRRAVYVAGVLASLLWLGALFPLLDSRQAILIVLAVSGALVTHAAMYGPQAAFIAEQFPTRVRYAGSSLAYTLAGIVGGGIAPMMFAALLRSSETTLSIVIYTAVALFITGTVLWCSGKGRE